MTLNRSLAPEIRSLQKIKIAEAKTFILNNGIPVYYVHAGIQDICLIELIFKAGTYYEKKRLQSFFTNALLNKGTSTKNAEYIAEFIDFHGSFLELKSESDFASVSLYSLNKHLATVLPVLFEIITESLFDEKELDLFKKRQLQKLAVNKQKVEYLARKKFNAMIFGNRHPYGHNPQVSNYLNINRNDLLTYLKTLYTIKNCTIIASGKIPQSTLSLLNKHFGNSNWMGTKDVSASILDTGIQNPQKAFYRVRHSCQSAIRIGKEMVKKDHSDFPDLIILNTILGGYFGSRLMANLREDKGYTYGIGSGIVSMCHAGFFFISTEVGTHFTTNTLKEIYKELQLLCSHRVKDEELQLVRNYLQGTFLASIDNPFALAEKFKGIWKYGLGYDYYYNYLDRVQNITPTRLLELSQKYLNPFSMNELVVGKKSDK